MIEDILINALNERLTAPCYAEVPKDPPSAYYIVEKTGGRIENHIRSAILAIESCSISSMVEASSMNECLIECMLYNVVKLEDIASVSLNSDYNFTDSTTKTYRYQAVFEVVYY